MSEREKIDAEEAWVRGVKPILERREQDIDAATLARLAAARNRALEQKPAWFRQRPALAWAAGTGAVAVFGLLVLGVGLNVQPLAPQVDWADAEPAAIDLIAAQDNLEFYEDLDFILWLAEEDSAG